MTSESVLDTRAVFILRDPLCSLTTTNDLQRSSGGPPPTSNVRLRSAPFS